MTTNNDRYIYEVIRIIDTKPLFLEEHFERLEATLKLQGAPDVLTSDKFASDMADFIKSEAIVNDNVKFILRLTETGADYYFEHLTGHYPSEKEYAEGVNTQLLHAMRDNPHAKVHNQALRELANKIIEENNLWEVILVDDEGFVTEGSRSNIFFIRDRKVITCPSEGVLLGVTRQQIIAACEDNGIAVVEEPIAAARLGEYDAAFVSGTSPKVLPIAKVGEVGFDVNEATLRNVMRLFDERIDRYLEEH
ncbi:MAG: aminotransferase class IV [Eubacterium sp.]|nr:aminotransferase class IV [Candidatus Colimonas fimequi]